MSYSAPPLFIASTVLTSPQLNVLVTDLIDLDRRTSPVAAFVTTFESTSATVPSDMTTAGPSQTANVGANGKLEVSIYADFTNTSAGAASYVGYALSGATTRAATTDRALQINAPFSNNFFTLGATILEEGLNPGMTTVTMKYWVSAGTINAGFRRMLLLAMGA